MALPALKTFKLARFHGKGDNPLMAILGTNAQGSNPQASPHFYVPLITNCPDKFFFRGSNEPGYVSAQFTETITAAGTGSGTIAESADGLLFTTDDADNDGNLAQLLRAFTPASGKYAIAYARLKVSDATQSDVYFGFFGTDTSPVASEPGHGAYFKKDDGDTILNGRSNDGGTGTETANLVTDFTADTEYDLAVLIYETSKVVFFHKLASASAWTATSKTTDLPAAAVRFSMLFQNGEAAIKTMTVSRWYVGWTL
jgi:hypothetical protein